MGRALKALGLIVCCALIGIGCGDDESSTTTDSSAAIATTTQEREGEGEERDASEENGQPDKSDSRGDTAPPSPAEEAKEAKSFVPKQHDDSGGGSEQHKVRGGDNSVQEFGEEVSGTEFEEASATLHNFLDARAAPNWAAACSYMSKGQVESFEQLASRSKQLEGSGCAPNLEAFTNQAALPLLREEAERADVVSLRMEGDRAFLIYRGLKGSVMAMPMAREAGTWKVAGLAGTPLN